MIVSMKEKLTNHELLIGVMVSLPSAETAEILCQAGFDWLFVDMEHGALNITDAQLIQQVAAPNTPCLVRVPAAEEVWIKKVLDTGPAGIVVPQVNTPELAAKVVQWAKYPPLGARSVGVGRAHGYGPDFQNYVDTANEKTSVVVQVEHIQAVENIEEIVKVPGIDALFIGPYDLSGSMNKTGRVGDKDVQEAIARTKSAADAAGLPIGIFGVSAQAVQPYIEAGFTLICAGIESTIFALAAAAQVASLKP